MSTEEAVRSVVQDAEKKPAGDINPGKTGDSEVLELKPASPKVGSPKNSAAGESSQIVVPGKKSKKSALENVHGEAYGALDSNAPGNNRSGAAVGAGSKSGKTHVYVETDRSRATRVSPH